MRSGDRVVLRQLVLEGYFYRDKHSKYFGDWTEHNYRFVGPDGKSYFYIGRYIPVEMGQVLDCRASVKGVNERGDEITISYITPIPALDNQPKLL